jgi:hypothetical protein
LAATWERAISGHERLRSLQAQVCKAYGSSVALDRPLRRLQEHLGRCGARAQLVHLEAERTTVYLSLQVGLQAWEMLYARQSCSMESNMAIVNLDMFDDESDRKSRTRGACRRRWRARWCGWGQYAAEIPLSFGILHQRCLGMHEVDVLDDQTFGEQCREIIPEPYLVQVRHLHARTVTQYHVAQHEGRK